MSIHEMLSVQDPEILSLVSDYKLNLVAPASMTDEELDQFTTSLREVMLFIKYSKDKAKLNELVQKDARFKNVDRKAATVISTVTGTEIAVEDEEETVDMCQALREMMEDASNEGMQKGMQDERMAMAQRMLQEGIFTMELIARVTHLPVDEIKSLIVEPV